MLLRTTLICISLSILPQISSADGKTCSFYLYEDDAQCSTKTPVTCLKDPFCRLFGKKCVNVSESLANNLAGNNFLGGASLGISTLGNILLWCPIQDAFNSIDTITGGPTQIMSTSDFFNQLQNNAQSLLSGCSNVTIYRIGHGGFLSDLIPYLGYMTTQLPSNGQIIANDYGCNSFEKPTVSENISIINNLQGTQSFSFTGTTTPNSGACVSILAAIHNCTGQTFTIRPVPALQPILVGETKICTGVSTKPCNGDNPWGFSDWGANLALKEAMEKINACARIACGKEKPILNCEPTELNVLSDFWSNETCRVFRKCQISCK